MTANDYFKITYADGRVEYEPRDGQLPSVRMSELFAEHPGCKLGIVNNLPADIRDLVGVEIKVGDMVRLRAYGTGYIGKVEKVGTKHAKVKITLASGFEKTISRPLRDLVVTL